METEKKIKGLRSSLFYALFSLSVLLFIILILSLLTDINFFGSSLLGEIFGSIPALLRNFLVLSLTAYLVYPDRFKKFGRYFNYFVLLLIFSLFINWAFHYPHPAFQLMVQNDGVGYYAYIRSLVIDKNLDFEDEFRLLWPDRMELPEYQTRTITGHIPNLFSIGPSLLWSPFFISAHLSSKVLNYYGAEINRNGFSNIYLALCSIGTVLYGFMGILIIYSFLKIFFTPAISFMGTVFILLGTPLTYYFSFELFMAHVFSFSLTALYIFYLFRYFDRRYYRHWIIAGIILGLASLVRWQNISYIVLLFLLYAIEIYKDGYKKIIADIKNQAAGILLFFLSLFIAILPQLIMFKIIYGFWLGVPQGPGFLFFEFRKIYYILFSPHNGLFQWHPLTFIAVVGLIISSFRSLKNLSLLLVFLLQVYITSLPGDWWGGHAFGMRRMINTSILLAFGLAYLINLSAGKKNILLRIFAIVLIGACILLSIANVLMVYGYIIPGIYHGVPHYYSMLFRVAFEVLSGTIYMNYPELLSGLVFMLLWVLFFEYRLRKILG